jgi:hypothetical protein
MKENSMQRSELENSLSQRLARTTYALSGVLMAFWIVGCGGSTTSSTPAMSQQAPQSYFAPEVEGGGGIQTYIIDDVQSTFALESFALTSSGQVGLQVSDAGDFMVNQPVDQRGLRSFGILTSYSSLNSIGENTGIITATNYPQPGLLGSFAVELAGQAGGLIQMAGNSGRPLVAATQCPSSTVQTYQFITIPEYAGFWLPATDPAYGSVDIASSGSTVNFKNILQYTLGSKLVPPVASTVTGACGPTTLGDITGVPSQFVITDPGVGAAVPPQAAIGIGSTGLLVEDNGGGEAANGQFIGINVFGAGNGAVGLPKPSGALDTATVIGQQYLGFVYGAGEATIFGQGDSSITVPSSSHLASFGFPAATQQSKCSAFAAQTGTLVKGIYGGDFQQTKGLDDPSTSPDGFGNCDFAIDLGVQDPSNNGLYPNATAWVGGVGVGGAGYAGNIAGTTYSFPAVAIVGQLNGKYAIFLIGTDSTQPWAIYLMQSN